MTDPIHASAPARIDLAGGTLDIWPLCHLLKRPALTVNLAIDLRAHVRAEPRSDGQLKIVSEDKDETVRMPVDAITHERLALATRMAEWFGPGDGLTITMRSTVPPGAGLGGSSALAVALAGALGRLSGKEWNREVVQNIETKVLFTPTGYQDYYPPLFGGVSRLLATPAGVRVDPIEGGVAFLKKHLLLVDTRIEHHSGLTNWEVVRRFLDGDATVRAALDEIAEVSAAMATAIEQRDLAGLAEALNNEWALRRRLSPVVTNERIDAMVEQARHRGARAAKICGAGGGGCLVLVVEDANVQLDLDGGAPVAFSPDSEGLTVA